MAPLKRLHTCEDEEVEGGGAMAIMSELEGGAGDGKIERESSVMRLPNRAGSGSALVEA